MPNGYIHLDGNRRNFSKDNLLEVSTEELKLFHKMKHEKLSPEYTKALFLAIRLNNKLEALKKASTARTDSL